MILMPILIYPTILIIHGDLLGQLLSKKSSKPIEISFIQLSQNNKPVSEDFKELREFIINGSTNAEKNTNHEIKKKIQPKYIFNNLILTEKLPILPSEDHIQLVFHPENATFKKGEIQIFFNSENDLAFVGKAMIQGFVEDYNAVLLKKLLKENNISLDVLNPLVIKEPQNLAPPEHFAKKYGGAIMAIMLIFLTYISCQYAATEVMPAEREQLTLETLLTTPLQWKDIIIGKYLAIVVGGLFNSLLNLLGMVLFGGSIIGIIANLKSENLQFDIPYFRIALMLFSLIPLAFMCAGVALFLISFARNRMSASYLSIPGMLLVISPAMLVLLPNVQLEGIWLLLPFANITLYIRNLFIGDIPLLTIISLFINVTLFSSIITFFSIIISNQKDKVLLGGINFSFFHKPKTSQPGLSFSEGIIITIISFICFILIGQIVQTMPFLKGIAIPFSFFLTLFVPAYFFMVFKKVKIEKFIKLYIPTWQQTIGAVLFVVPMFALATLTAILFSYFVPEINTSGEIVKIINSLYEKNYFWGVIFIIAITPGIFEEFIMRGVLFHSLKIRFSPIIAILITGIFFGFVHGFLRMIPIIPVGICLTWLVYRTQSLLLPMIAHIIFNSVSILMTISPTIEKKMEIKNFTTQDYLSIGVYFIICVAISYSSYYLLTKYPHKNSNEA
jgi:membrane protease YdiL (CAAX protease family)